ncbi:hypothetical protein GSI_02786 [Ganoderma sinense ZZ0214-1]|uniref:Uncharacterized protein n=1 Tax=Ganoderma sinense ZZ0214-1 TaxID=1077348 RepID=A0A2G8SMM7_9APHY|nr:hypothetical protein GSI_02786 [Ganoderma sinense ZZ0214-1]
MSHRTIVRRRRSSTAQGKHTHTISHARRGVSRKKLEIDVPAGWIDCDMPQHQLISRAQAISQYRLKPSDLRKIGYKTGVSIDGHPVRLYNERSVEGLAWDRYGGPCGLWRWLKRLYDRHISEHGDTALFATPFSYRPGREYDLTLPRPPPDPPAYDPYVGRSRRLQQVKASLPAWIWLACNAALDRTAPHDGRLEVSGSQSLSDSRKAAMQHAVRFARGYSPRDQTARPLSPWIVCLRNVLKSAPKLPPRRAWGARVDDLEFFEAPGHRRGHGHYEWSGAYTERVLKALRDVLIAHVDRQTIRQYVLWEIYDAYSGSLGCGIRYDPVTETWSDPAAAWLDISGQSPADAVQYDLRRRRPAGLRRANHNFLMSPTPSPAKTSSGLQFSVP